MNISIRPYRQSDETALVDVWHASSRQAHPFLSDEFLNDERIRVRELYLPNADTWVAIDDGEQLAGFLALLGPEVGALFVAPLLQGKGIGRALMDKAVSLHGRLELDVFRENASGRDFYARYGFRHVSDSVFEATGDKVMRLAYDTGVSGMSE